MKNSERIYRILLKAYPKRYLHEYGESMAQLFVDQLRDADSLSKLTRLWIRTLTDLIRTLPARYAERSHVRGGIFQFADQARKAVFFARHEASSFGKREVTTEHLLLGVLREDKRLAHRLLGERDPDAIVQEIETAQSSARRFPQTENLRVSKAGIRAIKAAIKEAAGGPVEARHLLAGIFQQKSSLAANLLRRHGVDLSSLRSED